MSGPSDNVTPGADAFMAFWTDFWNRMSSSGVTPPKPAPDMSEQMRKVFLESLTAQADRFMRSEAFLTAMKQSMDQALAWQQMMNQYLQRNLAAAQAPTREDTDHVVLLVRGMEERVMGKLEELTRRIERLEKPNKTK